MPTILIVDDDDAVRGTLYDLLSERYECHTTGMAEEALQYLEVEAYDAVLTDLTLPGLDGVSLLKAIRTRRPATPVIMISGKSGEDGESLNEMGAFAYLTKPFSLAEVEQVIERALGQKG
jgi:DNA-binding NtrC family response regulator